MLVAWTTVTHRTDAERIAVDIITRNLAACVQVDGPVASHYRWNDRLERTEEYRLAFKFLDHQAVALEARVLATHPYDTPEWVVVRAERVAEKYLSWANTNSSNPPL
ncbi:MAG: divalent-cation tolerance protein CutA [Opitutus sp.]